MRDSKCKFPSERQAPVSWVKWEEDAQDIKGLSINLETGNIEMEAVLPKGADPGIPTCQGNIRLQVGMGWWL